ncbi:phasin family protein [Mesorhizobium sp. ES1-3]|uniref:phasin family protein n=1 Tax=Mesorhizobium sp. ES1-3 TaxID=2876628 RepID=UPI001CCFB6A0|nr:phasin family protein [Mesorhizobium sp. ES1-3]MBZ9672274.1 phasin family protein [Mesorhizobium sp. ES1-3]
MISIKDMDRNGVNLTVGDHRLYVVGTEQSIMQTTSVLSSLDMPLLPTTENGQKFFLAIASLQVHAFKAMMRYNVETLGFLKHRCEQDLKLADDLISGPQFNDAFDIVAAFLQNATSQYVTEGGKVATLTSKFASETARHVRKGARIAIEDGAAKTVA